MIVKLQAFSAWSADGRDRSVLWLVNILGSFPLIVGANVLLINKLIVYHKEHKVYQQLFRNTDVLYKYVRTFGDHTLITPDLLPAWLHNVTTTEKYDRKLTFGKTKLSNTFKKPKKSWIPVILLIERLFFSLKGMYYHARFA